QQFKDSLIWEAAKSASRSYRVAFVTNDKGYFENDQVGKGLATELRNEIDEDRLKVFNDLDQLLVFLRAEAPPTFDRRMVASKFASVIFMDVSTYAKEKGFTLDAIKGSEIRVFETDETNLLSVKFRLDFGARRIEEDRNTKDTFAAIGSGSIRIPSFEVVEFR